MVTYVEMSAPQVGLVGCGYWGFNIARTLQTLGVLRTVADLKPENAEKAAREFECVAVDWQEMLHDKSITAIAIATPASEHEVMVLQALRSGKHVFVEKPAAFTVRGLEKLSKQSIESRRLVMVGHQFRFHPAFQKLESLVRDGVLGKLQQCISRRVNFGSIRSSEDAYWHLAPHDLSMILCLIDEEPSVIQSSGSSLSQDSVQDSTSIHLKFPTKSTADVFVSWLFPVKERVLTVIGDRGMAIFDDCAAEQEKLQIFDHQTRMVEDKLELLVGKGTYIPVEYKEPLLVGISPDS